MKCILSPKVPRSSSSLACGSSSCLFLRRSSCRGSFFILHPHHFHSSREAVRAAGEGREENEGSVVNRGRLESYGVARDERNETTSYGEDRSSEVTSERSSVQITSVVPFLVHLLTTSLLLSLRHSLLLHLRSGGPVGAEVTEEPRDQGAGGWRRWTVTKRGND